VDLPPNRRPRSARPPALVAAALLACAACRGEAREVGAGPPPRNLLLVVLDTTRADHLTSYGYGVDTSPTVERLARAGTLFERAYAQSSLTPVSAGSFLSGLYPHRHGVRSLFMVAEESLAADVPTLAQWLGEAGRRTAAFVSAVPMGAQYGLDRGFETYADSFPKLGAGGCGRAYQRRADDTTRLALEWLDANGSEPFALMVHFFDVHDATLSPPRGFLADRVSFPLPADTERPCALRGLRRDEHKVELYDAEIRFMDRELARLLGRLDDLGVRDETLVCVIADHGEGLGDNGVWTHGWLYEKQLHVPLVLQGPGVPAGLRVAETVRLVDLAPTLLELFDLGRTADGLERLDGRSLLSLMAGLDDAPREVYAEVHHAAEDRLERDTEMYALVRDGWKYVHRPSTGDHELYRLPDDPDEAVNLYAADHPAARDLAARLAAMEAEDGRTFRAADLDPARAEALESLGYLGDEGDAGGSGE